MPDRSKIKRPHDINQLAKLIVDISIGDIVLQPETARTKASRKGGLKGGTARAAKLSTEERSQIAKKAATARWKSVKAK